MDVESTTSVQDTGDGSTQRLDPQYLNAVRGCETLYARVMQSPGHPSDYANPSQRRALPFPSLFDTNQRDRFHFDPAGNFTYVGREQFPHIVDEVNARHLFNALKLNIYGTMGYGKSHILAALTCYFMVQNRVVVYIPDCAALVKHFVHCFKQALMHAYAHPHTREYWPDIWALSTIDDVLHFIENSDQTLLFIVDEHDALSGADSPDQSRVASEALAQLLTGYVAIMGVSANSRSYKIVRYPRNEAQVLLFGGMSETEMTAWWEIRKDELPKFENDATRGGIEDMTGRIPLLLSRLLQFKGAQFIDIEDFYWKDAVVRRPGTDITTFAKAYRSTASTRADLDFISKMKSFILCGLQTDRLDAEVDHRHLYEDDSRIRHVTCGIVREALAAILRQASPSALLGNRWSAALIQFRNNPQTLGFLVEQQCIAIIAKRGLDISPGVAIPPSQMTPFEGDSVKFSEPGFYVPTKPNCMAIDCVYTAIDEKSRTAHVIPIRITIAEKHTGSEWKFYENWDRWTEALARMKYTISTSFRMDCYRWEEGFACVRARADYEDWRNCYASV